MYFSCSMTSLWKVIATHGKKLKLTKYSCSNLAVRACEKSLYKLVIKARRFSV